MANSLNILEPLKLEMEDDDVKEIGIEIGEDDKDEDEEELDEEEITETDDDANLI